MGNALGSGDLVGGSVGTGVGCLVGLPVGLLVGGLVGLFDGLLVGILVGKNVGGGVGSLVGVMLGTSLGEALRSLSDVSSLLIAILRPPGYGLGGFVLRRVGANVGCIKEFPASFPVEEALPPGLVNGIPLTPGFV